MKRILLILLVCNAFLTQGYGFTMPRDILTQPSDTTRYGEDIDEETNDTIKRTALNKAKGTGFDAIKLVMERRYKAYGEEFTKKWHDHLFVQVGGGLEQMASAGKGYNFNTLSAVNIGVGKQFNKYNTLRMMLHGAWGYQQSKDRLFSKFAVRLDHSFSLSSFFDGYKPTRLLDISTLFGVGFQYAKLSYKNILWEEEQQKLIEEWEAIGDQEEVDIIRSNWPKDKSGTSFEAHIGAQLKFFTGPQGYINIEPYIGIGGSNMDLVNEKNWRKTDIFYGLNLNYIYYIHNNLSPRERINYIKNRKQRDILSADSVLLSWQQPWFFEYSNGIDFLTGTELGTSKTMGHDIAISVGRWFSPVIGLRLTGAVRQMTWRQSFQPIVEGGEELPQGYTTNQHNIYKGVRLEAMFNPLGFFENFSWNDQYGAYLVAGVEYGWVDKYQTERLSTRSEGYTGGIHLWYKLSDGLHFFVEPRYIHYKYKVPYTNVTWNKLYSDNSFSLSMGFSVATRTLQFRSMEHDEAAGGEPLRQIEVGAAGGFNIIHTKRNYEGGGGMGFNGKLVGIYNLNRIHGARASFEYVGLKRSGITDFYDYNMQSDTPEQTVVERQGMWNHNMKIGLASVGYQLNLSNAMAGYNASRRFDMSMFVGPTVIIPIGDDAQLSPDERLMAGHKVELKEPFKGNGIGIGAHLGVRVRMKVIPHVSAFVEPTLYLLGNTKLPSTEFLKVKYMQTVNIGAQYEF